MPIAYTPRIPEKSLSPEFWTYQDAVEWLLDFYGRTTASARDLRMAKRAVDNAYREIAQAHNWRCYRAGYAIHTDADYDTGTITYDHTGGAYERMLTLASGTWPANAAYGELKLSGYGPYPVAARISDTVITLYEDQNPRNRHRSRHVVRLVAIQLPTADRLPEDGRPARRDGRLGDSWTAVH